jgi:hypothetical protein
LSRSLKPFRLNPFSAACLYRGQVFLETAPQPLSASRFMSSSAVQSSISVESIFCETVTKPISARPGSVQLDVEADTARLRPGGRAAS